MNTYRATSPAAVAAFSEGVFERDFSVTEEKDWLDSGLLELVPRTYKVLSNNYATAGQGETFEAAFLIEIEAALIQGGHLERVDKPSKEAPADDKPAAKAAEKKEK
jgi:uncharacterized lipoprotein YddW (UPF0748 family)